MNTNKNNLEYIFHSSNFFGKNILITFIDESEAYKNFGKQLVVNLKLNTDEIEMNKNENIQDSILDINNYVKAIVEDGNNLYAKQAQLLETKGFNIKDILTISTDHMI